VLTFSSMTCRHHGHQSPVHEQQQLSLEACSLLHTDVSHRDLLHKAQEEEEEEELLPNSSSNSMQMGTCRQRP